MKKPEFKSIMASDLVRSIQKAIDINGDHEIFMCILNADKTATISSIDTIDMRDGGYDKDNMKTHFTLSNRFEMIGGEDYVSM